MSKRRLRSERFWPSDLRTGVRPPSPPPSSARKRSFSGGCFVWPADKDHCPLFRPLQFAGVPVEIALFRVRDLPERPPRRCAHACGDAGTVVSCVGCLRPSFLQKIIDNGCSFCYNKSCGFHSGEMAERFKALVLKTSDVERHRGFESLSLRQNRIDVEKYPRGRRGSPAKGVGWDNCREGSNPSFSATEGRAQRYAAHVLFPAF